MNSPEAIQQNLRRHVERLAGTIGPRTLKNPSSIEATIDYIEDEWSQMGYSLKQERFDAIGDQATNLIVEQPGSGRAEQIVLLGAHYDTVSSTPGADDNASAVAVLLEVSRLLRDCSCSHTIRYVAFACEEPPYFNFDSMGSQHHAREARRREEQIIAMLCLEMVGFFSDEPDSQSVPPTLPKWTHPVFPKRGNFLAAVGNLSSCKLAWQFRRGFKKGTRQLPLFSICLPEKVNEIRRSDNSSFWDQGYSALMLTDTSFLRNPHYHQPTDTPETLDYVRMAEVVIGVAAAMKHLGARPR